MRNLLRRLVLVIGCTAAAQLVTFGSEVRSPNVGHTFTYSRMIDHQLRWIPSEGALIASVTFSNVDYMSREEQKQEDEFQFYLPGIRFDPKSGVFRDPDGIPVAVVRRVLIGSEIRLLPNARIFVSNRSGAIHVILRATNEPQQGSRWNESDSAEMLPDFYG